MSDRHPKWQRVEPGTVIPAGQPYRVEYSKGDAPSSIEAQEYQSRPVEWMIPLTTSVVWFVDSSWKPLLDLPTTPTWGIAVFGRAAKHPFRVSKWHQSSGWFHKLNGGAYSRAAVTDFIPLTPEQVARIEATRPAPSKFPSQEDAFR
jgi:hypothetical protein